MPIQPPLPSPVIRRFNAAVETFDTFTLFRYDRVSSVPALLRHAERELGKGSGLLVLLTTSANALNHQTK